MWCDNTCCVKCIYYRHIDGVTNADPDDCYPPEEWCEEDSDNFGTEDGCRNYEERLDEWYDDER